MVEEGGNGNLTHNGLSLRIALSPRTFVQVTILPLKAPSARRLPANKSRGLRWSS